MAAVGLRETQPYSKTTINSTRNDFVAHLFFVSASPTYDHTAVFSVPRTFSLVSSRVVDLTSPVPFIRPRRSFECPPFRPSVGGASFPSQRSEAPRHLAEVPREDIGTAVVCLCLCWYFCAPVRVARQRGILIVVGNDLPVVRPFVPTNRRPPMMRTR